MESAPFTGNEGKRLILLSESKRRLPTQNPVPACERYQGVFVSVLRKYLRDCEVANVPVELDLFFISPTLGLVSGNQPVPYVEPYPGDFLTMRPDEQKATEIRVALQKIIANGTYSEVYINVGEKLRDVLREIDFRNLTVIYSEGRGPGPKARHMSEWLRGGSIRGLNQ